MKKKFLQYIVPLLGVVLFTVALWVLHQELRKYHYHDIIRHIKELPAERLLLGLALTALSYFVLTGYDTLSIRYIKRPLGYVRTAFASFAGYAFSHNIGFALLSGGSVRYRLYSSWGLSAEEVTKVVVFNSLTFGLGFCTMEGLAFLTEPPALTGPLNLGLGSFRLVGAVLVCIVCGYFLLNALRKKAIRIKGWEFSTPPLRLCLAQVAVSSADWAVAAGALYVLLPQTAGLTYLKFLSVFLMAFIAGQMSHVPGGLGVFEMVALLFLSPRIPAPVVMGSILAFRGIYYILPFCAATILLGSYEGLQKKEVFRRAGRFLGQLVPGLAPDLLVFTTFAGGVVLLFSGATPSVSGRMELLTDFIPLPLMEVSHFLGSLAGVWLLMLAWGLRRRLDAAYVLAVAMLAAGMVFSLLKGFEYEEAIILGLFLAALLPCRRYFYRRASLISQRFSPGWTAAIAIVLVCSVWLGFFSYKHVEYSSELWWRFSIYGDAPRFLRATVGVAAAALFFAAARLLSPAPPGPSLQASADLEQAGKVVDGSRKVYANIALLGDKTFLFNDTRTAFIMYAVEGRSWVAMGDPVGPDAEGTELAWRFMELCDLHDGWPVFYKAGQDKTDLYLDMGLELLKLGEEARVRLATFSLHEGGREALFEAERKFEGGGYTFDVAPRERVPALMPELKAVSDAWLAGKNALEKGFSLGSFREEYITRFPAALVKKDGKIVVFANIWLGARKEELAADLVRRLPETEDRVVDYLFLKLMLWGKGQGYGWFNLGMAPLPESEGTASAALWNKFGAYLYRHGERFSNLQELRQYKAGFGPEWEPMYLAVPGGLALPRIMKDIVALITRR